MVKLTRLPPTYGKHITKRKTVSENITCPVDKKINICQNKKVRLLTARRGKYISETMYRYINNNST